MGWTGQEWNGRSYPAAVEASVTLGMDKMEWARAGFQIPRPNTVLDATRFWQLTGEGWRFVVGESGEILAYLPPPLKVRLDALTDTNNLARQPKKKKENHG